MERSMRVREAHCSCANLNVVARVPVACCCSMQSTLKHENAIHDLINEAGSLAAVEPLQDFFDLGIFFLDVL
jgi:hypothetical protein